MRIAIFAVTVAGGALARRIHGSIDSDRVSSTVYLAEKLKLTKPASPKELSIRYFTKLGEALRQNFNAYDAIVCIMATGIVVRLIAPLIKSKLHDPAVIVFDEQGHFGISLISGHVGGANELTKELCDNINATPVITTATDVEGQLAPDALASRLALRPYPKVHIQTLNSALLAGEKLDYIIDNQLARLDYYEARLKEEGIGAKLRKWSDIERSQQNKPDNYRVIITSEKALRAKGMDVWSLNNAPLVAERTLYLVPRRLIAGVGCRAGVPMKAVLDAIDMACSRIGVDRSFVDMLASTTFKRNELGLLAAATAMMREIQFFDNEALASMITKYGLEESSFVKENIGVGNVSEAAALYATRDRGGRVALPKTKFQKVTVALIWEK